MTRSWTVKDEKLLQRFYATGSDQALAFFLKRTQHAIRCRASKLGLRKINLFYPKLPPKRPPKCKYEKPCEFKANKWNKPRCRWDGTCNQQIW